MTFMRDEQTGMMVEVKKYGHTIVESTVYTMVAYSELINGILSFCVKVGLLIFLFPYTVTFFNIMYHTLNTMM